MNRTSKWRKKINISFFFTCYSKFCCFLVARLWNNMPTLVNFNFMHTANIPPLQCFGVITVAIHGIIQSENDHIKLVILRHFGIHQVYVCVWSTDMSLRYPQKQNKLQRMRCLFGKDKQRENGKWAYTCTLPLTSKLRSQGVVTLV